jgi:hypothetical protein
MSKAHKVTGGGGYGVPALSNDIRLAIGNMAQVTTAGHDP